MAAAYTIVDGYNLLHAAGLSRARYGTGDLQRQRHRLLVQLNSLLTSEEKVRCTIVFDALEAPTGLERQFRHGELTVMFAEPGHEADELIEALISVHPSARQLLVVSSDHRLQKAAKQRRAESVDSEVYLEGLNARAKSRAVIPESTKPKSSTSATDDVAYWLGEFGPIDVDALARKDDPDAESKAADPWQKNLDDLQRRLNSDQDLEDWLNRPPGTK